jgi:hypothetical protein
MQDVTCSYSTNFGATFVATLPNVVRVFPNVVRIFKNSASIFPNGVRIFSNGGSIFPNGGSIFPNGVRIFPNGGSIFRSSLLSACSYKSSSKKSGVATGNGLFVSPFSAKVAPVARFLRVLYARASFCRPRHGSCNQQQEAVLYFLLFLFFRQLYSS